MVWCRSFGLSNWDLMSIFWHFWLGNSLAYISQSPSHPDARASVLFYQTLELIIEKALYRLWHIMVINPSIWYPVIEIGQKEVFWPLSHQLLYPCSTVVEHSTQNPKIEGSNPTADTGRENMAVKLPLTYANPRGVDPDANILGPVL